MTLRRIIISAVVGLFVLLVSTGASADEAPPCDEPCFFDTDEPTTITKDDGKSLRLPPGYFLSDPVWEKRETEMKRLQEVETRLTAENESFRKSASSWQPGWKVLLGAFVVGVAGGAYAAHRWL